MSGLITQSNLGIICILCILVHVDTVFVVDECGIMKTCFIPTNCKQKVEHCDFAASLNIHKNSTASYLEIELTGKGSDRGRYLALGFSTDDKMGNDFVSECSSIDNGPLTPRLSYNNKDPANQRIDGLSDSDIHKLISNVQISTADGMVYCKFTQQVTNLRFNNPMLLTYTKNAPYYLLLARGQTTKTGLNIHDSTALSPLLDSLDADQALGSGSSNTKRLIKAHAMLMVTAWFCFVPTAVFFARFMRDAWPDYKPFGLLMWFHVHRNFNLLGIALMISSMIIILTAKKWKWTGPGSGEYKWVEIHTATGISAVLLAVLQPFISAMRCNPKNPRRSFFNWIHRIVGSVAIFLATLTFGYGSWNALEVVSKAVYIVVEVLPFTCLVGLSIVFYLLERTEVTPKNINQHRYMRYGAVFVVEALLLAITITFCVFIAVR